MNGKRNPTKQEEIQVGAQTISYSLTFASRKSVGITIRPDLSVDVRAPRSMSRLEVAEIMHKRANWILGHLEKFAQRAPQSPPSTKSTSGAYAFLGRQLSLKLMPATARVKEQVVLEKDAIQVWVKEINDQARVDALLEKWSREQAESIFLIRLTLLYSKFKYRTSNLPDLKIRRMKARWGSCSTNGVITLNVKLIHLDLALIDYVVMHEICHLIEHNHSKEYYALLGRTMPDWRQRRQQLNEVGMPE